VNALYEPANRTNQGRVSAHSVRTRLDQADVLARATGLDMVEAGWRPTVDNYLGRVAKPRILDAVREAKGASSAQLIDHLKKTDMAKEAERLLDGSGWLPEPLRLVDLAASPAEPEGEAGRLPEFLTEGEEGQESASDDERPQLDAAERDCIAGRPRPSCSPWGPGRERRSPCSWQRFKRESRAGKGLNCRGLKESAGRFGPVPLSRDILP
jgi:ParB family chromosome partitioning protein